MSNSDPRDAQVDGEWKNEFIRDPHVIKAYLRAKEDHEMQNQSVENLMPTGNEEMDAKARARYVWDHVDYPDVTDLSHLQNSRGDCTSEEESGATSATQKYEHC